jgi:hypothetical protein
MEKVVKRLPDTALGHAKGYVEFQDGTAFASSTVVPPQIDVKCTGEYKGGDMNIHLTLIFVGIEEDVLKTALDQARSEVLALF